MNRTILFAMAVIIIDAMGIGLLMPVLPDLLAELQGIDPATLTDEVGENPIGELAGVGMWIAAAYMAMQFLFGPTLGNLSDRFGRRRVLLVSLFALGIDYLIMGFASTLWMLFVGRILAGIAGATYGTAYAAVADVSSPEDKARNFGLIGAGFGIGFVFGPLLGAGLAEFGTRAPIFAAAGLSFLNFALGAALFAETLPAAKRRAFSWLRANPLGALAQVRTVPQVHRWLAVAFIFGLAFTVYPAVWSYYGRAVAGWGAREIGISLGIVGVGFALVQVLVLPRLIERFGTPRVLQIGLIASLISFIGLAFAQTGWQIYLLTPFSALGIIVNPAIQSLLSNSVSEQEQGEIQGINGSIAAIAALISPFIMVGSFAYFTPAEADAFRFPGAPFLICAGLMLVLMGLTRRS